MQRAEQIAIGHQLFDYIDNRTTAMADEVYRQPVREYTCPDIAAEEERVFFRQRPLCVGMSDLLPEPGDGHAVLIATAQQRESLFAKPARFLLNLSAQGFQVFLALARIGVQFVEVFAQLFPGGCQAVGRRFGRQLQFG